MRTPGRLACQAGALFPRVSRRRRVMTADGMSRKDADAASAIRFDRWLWAARFFKTRALAAEAISGGRVHLNGARTKPASPTQIGDTVSVQRGEIETVIVVRGIAEQRRPAPEAALLY